MLPLIQIHVQIQISPFFLPTDASTFNFVSRALTVLMEALMVTVGLGMRYPRCCHHIRYPELVFRSRGEMAASRTSPAAAQSGRRAPRRRGVLRVDFCPRVPGSYGVSFEACGLKGCRRGDVLGMLATCLYILCKPFRYVVNIRRYLDL